MLMTAIGSIHLISYLIEGDSFSFWMMVISAVAMVVAVISEVFFWIRLRNAEKERIIQTLGSTNG